MNSTSEREAREILVGDPSVRDLRCPLRLHRRLLEQLDDPRYARFRARLTHLLQLLAAGETQRSKSTQGVNRGWRRAPLGGNSGYHYYLWWREGSVDLDGTTTRAIEVYGIRHHDETDVAIGATEPDELVLRWPEMEEHVEPDGGLTEDQRRFVTGVSELRVLEGSPGSGKTSALWQSLVSGGWKRILYLTFSERLRDRAVAFLGASDEARGFLPRDTHLTALSLHAFVAALAERDLERRSVDRTLRDFLERLAQHSRAYRTLYGEDEAKARFEFFRLYPAVHSPRQSGVPRGITDDADLYRKWRQASMKELDLLGTVFPDAALGHAALERVLDPSRPLPQFLADVDCIAIDEAQDLTHLEQALTAELWRRLRKDRRAPVTLLVAGDERQTVRPTSFEWSAFNRLLTDGEVPIERRSLSVCHRAPERLFRVIDNASSLYRNLQRANRPAGSTALTADLAEGSDVLYAEATHDADWRDQARELAGHAATVVLAFDDHDLGPPGSELHGLLERGEILRPETAKGLEFERVVVLGLSRQLERIAGLADRDGHEQQARYEIDRLIVALSRATHVIAALDLKASTHPKFHEKAAQLLGVEHPVDIDFLRRTLATDEPDADRQASTYAEDALQSIEAVPERALRRAIRAADILRDFDAMLSETTRGEVRDALRAVLCDRWASLDRPATDDDTRLLEQLDSETLRHLWSNAPPPLSALDPVRTLDLFRTLQDSEPSHPAHGPLLGALRRHRGAWLAERLDRLVQGPHAVDASLLDLAALLGIVVPDDEILGRVHRLEDRALESAARNRREPAALAWARRVRPRDRHAAIRALLDAGDTRTALAWCRSDADRRLLLPVLRDRGEIEASFDALPDDAEPRERETVELLHAALRSLQALRGRDDLRPAELDALVDLIRSRQEHAARQRHLDDRLESLERRIVELTELEERVRTDTRASRAQAAHAHLADLQRVREGARRELDDERVALAKRQRELDQREEDLQSREADQREEAELDEMLRAERDDELASRSEALDRRERELSEREARLERDAERVARTLHAQERDRDRSLAEVAPAAPALVPTPVPATATATATAAPGAAPPGPARPIEPVFDTAPADTAPVPSTPAPSTRAPVSRWNSLRTIEAASLPDATTPSSASERAVPAEEDARTPEDHDDATSSAWRLELLRDTELCSPRELEVATAAALGRDVTPNAAVTREEYVQVRKALTKGRRASSVSEICSRAGRKRPEVMEAARAALGRDVDFDETLPVKDRRKVIAALKLDSRLG